MIRQKIVFVRHVVWNELNKTIITVENAEEKVVSLLNIVPMTSFRRHDCDLMRKTCRRTHGMMGSF